MDELRKGIAIGMLFGSGSEGHGNLMTKTATENGTYTAAEEIDPETGEIFDPPKDGYSVFTVDLALDDKSVSFTASQITGSQTAEFEYDPHDENPELEGYSLFTIDLSAVKDDIEDLQQQVSDLEDELEQCHDCWEEVVAKLQEYDPDYDPDEGECPTEEIGKVIDEKEHEIEALEEQIEECDQCKADVIAKLQEYDPDFDPQTCSDIPPEIDKIVEDNKGYEFPPKPDGTYPTPPEIAELAGLDPITDTTTNVTLKFWMRVRVQEEIAPVPYEELITYFPITAKDVRGEDVYPNPPGGYPTRHTIVEVGITYTDVYGEHIVVLNRNTRNREEYVSVDTYSLDPQTGTVYMKVAGYYASNPQNIIYTEDRYTDNSLIGYGDDTHPYKVTKSS